VGIAVALLPDAGAPQVGITVTGMPTSTSSVLTVQVSSDDGATWWPVRGADHLTVTGGATFIRDFVPALNTVNLYELIVHTGATPTPTQASITVPADTAWIQDPLYPALAVPVECMPFGDGVLTLADSFASMIRDQRFDAVLVTGARYPVAAVGIRQAPSRIPLHLRTTSTQPDLTDDLRTLLAASGVLVLRGLPAAIPLDAVAHVVVGGVEERPVIGGLIGERNDWSMTATQVRPVAAAIVVPWFTYAAVFAAWSPSTYADAMAARPGEKYLDWLRDPQVP
jgi:hypothetical protein